MLKTDQDVCRAEELERLERWRDAMETWRALARQHSDVKFLLRAAYAAIDGELYEEAEMLLTEIISGPIDVADAYFELGRLRWKQNRLEEARKLLQQGLGLEERQPILTILGGIHRVLRDEELARTTLLRSLELNAQDDEAYYELGQTELLANPLSAAEHFRRAIEIDSELPFVWRQLGEALWRAGRLPEAEQALREALKRDDADALAHDYLGHLFGLRHDWLAARSEFATATSLDSTVGMFWRNLADACAILGQRDEAERCYLRSLSLEIDSAHANARYGLFLKDTGHLSRAESYLRRAVQIDPDQRQARKALDDLQDSGHGQNNSGHKKDS